ncbi:MAG: MoaD/ThiS family protein [Desulfobacterales bacterium]|jgi:sulfur carrier protein ThiS|nr:MoaD/ThiS family protein [Desulfobacteraceae bacterium]MDD3991319.1 MoaD/ThiS family protein [Desulfobacteraceae bacterium]MDY0310628.1 MoaD/ThiS family protein [Desulfobacterales bacterium]
MPIQIELRLYASLKPLEPASAASHPLPSGTTVGEVLAGLKVPGDQVKLVFVNGRKAHRQRVLQDGDRLGVFPPVGGG